MSWERCHSVQRESTESYLSVSYNRETSCISEYGSEYDELEYLSDDDEYCDEDVVDKKVFPGRPPRIPFSDLHKVPNQSDDYFIPGQKVKVLSITAKDDPSRVMSHWIYTVVLKHVDKTWSVHRRYKHFHELHRELLVKRAQGKISELSAQFHRDRSHVRKPSRKSLPRFPKTPDALVSDEKIERRCVQLTRYLQNTLNCKGYRESVAMRKFLEVSRLSFVHNLGFKSKEGIIKKRSGGRRINIGSCSCLPQVTTSHWSDRWMVVKDTFLAYLHPEDGRIGDVLLMDQDFRVNVGFDNTGVHHGLKISNLSRHLLIKCWTRRKAEEWQKCVEQTAMTLGREFTTANRFDSFAPERTDTLTQWFVDGCSYFDSVATALDLAREEIFITDWWLSPELYLKRPVVNDHTWRLDHLLVKKAREGVKIFILLYKEIEMALGINSYHSKTVLKHDNIKVLRHPDHGAGGVLLWAHHEKIVCVDQRIAFIGGLDLCYGRWDDQVHRLTDLGQVNIQFEESVLSPVGIVKGTINIMDAFVLQKPVSDILSNVVQNDDTIQKSTKEIESILEMTKNVRLSIRDNENGIVPLVESGQGDGERFDSTTNQESVENTENNNHDVPQESVKLGKYEVTVVSEENQIQCIADESLLDDSVFEPSVDVVDTPPFDDTVGLSRTGSKKKSSGKDLVVRRDSLHVPPLARFFSDEYGSQLSSESSNEEADMLVNCEHVIQQTGDGVAGNVEQSDDNQYDPQDFSVKDVCHNVLSASLEMDGSVSGLGVTERNNSGEIYVGNIVESNLKNYSENENCDKNQNVFFAGLAKTSDDSKLDKEEGRSDHETFSGEMSRHLTGSDNQNGFSESKISVEDSNAFFAGLTKNNFNSELKELSGGCNETDMGPTLQGVVDKKREALLMETLGSDGTNTTDTNRLDFMCEHSKLDYPDADLTENCTLLNWMKSGGGKPDVEVVCGQAMVDRSEIGTKNSDLVASGDPWNEKQLMDDSGLFESSQSSPAPERNYAESDGNERRTTKQSSKDSGHGQSLDESLPLLQPALSQDVVDSPATTPRRSVESAPRKNVQFRLSKNVEAFASIQSSTDSEWEAGRLTPPPLGRSVSEQSRGPPRKTRTLRKQSRIEGSPGYARGVVRQKERIAEMRNIVKRLVSVDSILDYEAPVSHDMYNPSSSDAPPSEIQPVVECDERRQSMMLQSSLNKNMIANTNSFDEVDSLVVTGPSTSYDVYDKELKTDKMNNDQSPKLKVSFSNKPVLAAQQSCSSGLERRNKPPDLMLTPPGEDESYQTWHASSVKPAMTTNDDDDDNDKSYETWHAGTAMTVLGKPSTPQFVTKTRKFTLSLLTKYSIENKDEENQLDESDFVDTSLLVTNEPQLKSMENELDVNKVGGDEGTRLWIGKDYVNFIAKDFVELTKPYEDFIDRTTMPRMPWHDIGCVLFGKAARDVSRHFIQRWNFTKMKKVKTNGQFPLLLPKCYTYTLPATLFRETAMIVDAQILRSACHWSAGIKKMEDSIHKAYIHSIENAKHYIYIENQFFISIPDRNEVSNGIAEALYNRILRAHKNGEKFRVYVMMPLLPGFEGEIGTNKGAAIQAILHWSYLSISRGGRSLLEKLTAAGVSDTTEYISFYGLRQYGRLGDQLITELIYVHSKLMIVDDNVVIMGSANINDRSMLGKRDSEIAVYVKDIETRQSVMNGRPYRAGMYASSLRKTLFKEHLGIADTDTSVNLNDPVCDSFYKFVWAKTAGHNTRSLEKVFHCIPCDTVHSFEQLRMWQQHPPLTQTDVKQALILLKKVRGHLVNFPLNFLCKENLMPAPGTKEALVPTSLWT